MNRTLILFADYWDDMWRRRQQLAWRLAKRGLFEHVIYIERPLTTISFLKFLARQADLDGTTRWRRVLGNRSWVMPVDSGLSVLTTLAPLPPVGPKPFFEASERIRHRWLRAQLSRLGKRFDLDYPVVWVSHPQLPLESVEALRPRLLWYDCTEDFAAWPGLSDCVRAQIEASDRWLAEHADVVTAVSHTLFEEKQQVNPNTYWLPNAVDTDLFLQPTDSLEMPPEMRGLKHPVLAFVGGLNDWAHDWELLDRVATAHPNWTILLIGPLEVSVETRQMLKRHSGILCVGQQPYERLPNYLAHSDLCFLFYRRSRNNDTRNSQKLFLYLAAGKPVVSTPSADAMAYAEHVFFADTPESFVARVEEALATDSPAKALARQELARRNSWAARVDKVCQILEEKGVR